MGELFILEPYRAKKAGDTKIIWNAQHSEEVDNARRTFDDLTRNKGYFAYAVDESGEKGTLLRAFDPTIEKMILARQPVGG